MTKSLHFADVANHAFHVTALFLFPQDEKSSSTWTFVQNDDDDDMKMRLQIVIVHVSFRFDCITKQFLQVI